MKAYRIVQWKKIGEVDKGGKAASMKTSERNLRKNRPQFARLFLSYHALEPWYRRLNKEAYKIGKMMGMGCFGLYVMLYNLAGAWNDPKKRGLILDDLGRPMDSYKIAEHFELVDKEHVRASIELLCDPEIDMLEIVDFEDGKKQKETTGVKRGKRGGVQVKDGGVQVKDGETFLNETVTGSLNKNLNETEIGEPGDACDLSPPPSVMDSVLASEISDSVSDTVPRAGGIGKAKNIYLNHLQGIIAPKGQEDITTFRDIADQLSKRMLTETEFNLFDLSLQKARESSKIGRVPAAMFVAAMKEPPFNYVPRGTSVIRGRKDGYRK